MSLHSTYNPLKEAERYLDTFQFLYIPLFIVVTEPGESYLAHIIKKRFPDTQIIAIRYTPNLFYNSDNLWDYVWRPESDINLEKFLFNLISDEDLALTYFVHWKPSDNKWPIQAEYCWKSIASLIKLQQNIMFTRSHFGKQWLNNIVMNTLRLHTVLEPKQIVKPVFLGAAGPSLENQFPLIKDRFYICSVSSALSCFLFHHCQPDLCIATDGGYWAGTLFRDIPETIPVAFPLEAYIPIHVIEKNPSIILDYGSVLEQNFLSIANIQGENAQRNGTVTGTAAKYLLDHCDSNVYVAGLDLESSASFSHARPHISVDAGVNTTNRLQPIASRLYSSTSSNSSLDIYASWFSSRDENFKKRFIRIKPEGRFLQGITSVGLDSILDVPGPQTQIASGVQNIQNHARIKNDIVDFLGLFRSEIASCIQNKTKKAIIETFVSKILNNIQYCELIQMICYTDYIDMTRRIRMSTGNVTEASIETICLHAGTFLEKLITRVIKNE